LKDADTIGRRRDSGVQSASPQTGARVDVQLGRPIRDRGPEKKGRRQMSTQGTVKWFNPTKGYGFIAPESGGKDIFVHISAVQKAGLRSLNEGQRLGFEIEQQQNGRSAAVNLMKAD
jgi:cold shock protein